MRIGLLRWLPRLYGKEQCSPFFGCQHLSVIHFYTYAINQTRSLAGKKILLLSVLRARAVGRPVIECSFNLSKDEFPENTRFVSSFHSSAALWQAMQQIRDVFCCVLVRKLLELVPAYTTSLWVVKFKTG